jgi:16S rRNA processing protein RimM
VSALAGCRVVTEEEVDVGEFVGAETTPGHDLWVVRRGDREYLIPAVAEIVRGVDLAARRITIRPPAGLLDLANP